jgi:fatty-acyl-CoA synthase
MRKLNVSNHWEYLCKQKTWVEIFEDTVKENPGKEALVFPESNQRITYREYSDRVNELAKGLFAIGVRKGMHVGIWMTNRPEWCFARLAIYKFLKL